MIQKTILPLLIIALFSSACSTSNKIETLKPVPDDAVPLTYDNTPSYINLPISIKLKDIETQTNLVLNGLIYEDTNIEDDDIEMKIWKLAPIQITSDSNEKIKTVLPLKVWVKYRIGSQKMGMNLYKTSEFDFNGEVTLTSSATLMNWKLSTATELKSLQWNESPTMQVFGKKMPITYLIDPTIQLFKKKIEKKIDESIEKSMDFKPNVLQAIEKITTPFQMSETYNSWLRINPIELYSTQAKLNKDAIVIGMGMKCTMETFIGQKPISKYDASKITQKSVAKIPNLITSNITAVSSYQEASRLMNKNFAGQVFGSGTKKVTVQNVDIWHKNGKMVIALDLLGSVNGTIYLHGTPQYNAQTKEIYFDNLDYVLDTKNKLTRTANWLAQGIILRKINESCRYSIQPNLEEGKKNILTYLKNYSPMTGVYVNGNLNDIQFQKIVLTNQAILAIIKVEGVIKISIDGLK